MENYEEEEEAAVADASKRTSQDWRVGNVGLLLINAAKQGSRDSLEFLFNNVPQGTVVAMIMIPAGLEPSYVRLCWRQCSSVPAAREQIDYTDKQQHNEVSETARVVHNFPLSDLVPIVHVSIQSLWQAVDDNHSSAAAK